VKAAWLWLVALAIAWMSIAAAPASDWAQAQAEEARTLKDELDALQRGLASTKSGTATAKAELRKEIEDLSQQLARSRVQNARLEEALPARERDRSEAAEARQLDELVDRLRARVDASEADPESLPTLVERALARVRSDASLRLDPEATYFDAHGREASGPILYIGRVAALRWDAQPVPLVGTAEGLREAVGLEPLRSDRGDIVLARAVLYDPDAPPPPPAAYADEGWRGYMDAGGPVMWVLFVIAVIAFVVVVERSFGLAWAHVRWRREQRRFELAVRQRRTATLLHVQSWIAKPLVIAAAARCPSCATPKDTDAEEGATQALMVMRERLQRRLSLVNVAAGVAPLLGLLGTVNGLVHTFGVVTTTGASEPQLLAAGISEALLTTQFGLAIAIPAFLAHALLSRAARRILASAEQTVLWYLHGADPIVQAVPHHDHGHAHGDSSDAA
jgi:biopolymer transport protein ExbB